MKVRYGFVANSSSTDFIIRFDSIPSSLEELRNSINTQVANYEWITNHLWGEVKYIIKEYGSLQKYREYLRLNAVHYLVYDYCKVDLFYSILKDKKYEILPLENLEEFQHKTLDELGELILQKVGITENCILFEIDRNLSSEGIKLKVFTEMFGENIIAWRS